MARPESAANPPSHWEHAGKPGEADAFVDASELVSWEERILAAVSHHITEHGRIAASTPFDEDTVKVLVENQVQEHLGKQNNPATGSPQPPQMTEVEVQQLLKQHTKNYLSEDRILDLLQGHTLTEERVRQIVCALFEEQRLKNEETERTVQALKEQRRQGEDTEQKDRALVLEQHTKFQEDTNKKVQDLLAEQQKVKEQVQRQLSDLGAHRDQVASEHVRLRTELDKFHQDKASLKKVQDMLAEHKTDLESKHRSNEEQLRGALEQQEQLRGALETHTAGTMTETRVRDMIDNHPDVGMSEERLKGFLDMHKTHCREMVLLHLSGTPQVHLGQLPTSPGPFAASQHARSLVQDKSVWTAGQYHALAAIPDAGHEGTLTHKDMERKLVKRAIAGQPFHGVSGYTQVEIHDMVNNVVKEIVGTFESLLDRLLIEKKQDTLRVMVAELLTEDVATTIATGREQLKKQEMGHIVDELGRLRQEFHDNRAEWEKRFMLAHELRDSQDDMWATVDSNRKDHAVRLGIVERDFVKCSDLDARLKVVADELAEMRVHVVSNISKHGETTERLEQFKVHCTEAFTSKAELEATRAQLDQGIQTTCEKVEQGLADLRKDCATVERVDKLQALHGERLNEMAAEHSKDKNDIDRLSVQLTKDQRHNVETFATKKTFNESIQIAREEREQMGHSLRVAVEKLEVNSATKRAVADDQKVTKNEISLLQSKLEDAANMNNQHSLDLRSLEEKNEHEMATREYAAEVAERQARRIANECDEKEEIAQLRREFDDERERLRQTIRQTQCTRKELTDAQELLHTVKLHSTDVEKTCWSLSQNVKSLMEREDQHWQNQQAAFAEWRQHHTDLEVQYGVLKEELRSNIEYQRCETEKLRHHSTQRYLEQMDKALSLNSTVGKLEIGHKELKDTVIRLPKVGQF